MKSLGHFAILGFLASLAHYTSASPTPNLVRHTIPGHHHKRAQQLAIGEDFPDPTIEEDFDGQWYAFGTNGNGYKIQVARAPAPEGPWTVLGQDALPDSGGWTNQLDNWAPDVKRLSPTSYVMFYSGAMSSDPAHHCVGTATASAIAGPYTAAAEPLDCHVDQGGSIDPSAFFDQRTNTRWITYKIDGNSVGNGGDCNNGVEPIHSTPIMLQQMALDDWVTPVGGPIQILDRTADDGPLVEAPNIIGTPDGHYVLFYSSHCFTDPGYDVRYAVATDVRGPYARQGQLIKSGDFGGLASPGGATATPQGDALVFHSDCAAGRCMHSVGMSIAGGVATVG